MSTIIGDFESNLTAALNAIAGSVIYTDIAQMHTDGRLQKDQMDKVIIAFHEKALSMAGATSENLALKGYRLDEIIAADLAEKTSLVTTRAAETAIKQAESTATIAFINAQTATEVERKVLVVTQARGFLDNRVVEWASMSKEAVSMVQAGGNEAPIEMFDDMIAAQGLLGKIASNHPENTIVL